LISIPASLGTNKVNTPTKGRDKNFKNILRSHLRYSPSWDEPKNNYKWERKVKKQWPHTRPFSAADISDL